MNSHVIRLGGPTSELVVNTSASSAHPYTANQAAILNDAAFQRARMTIQAWPGFAPTPLRSLPNLAAELGVAAIHYKDESHRLGLGSFKALGGAYAVGELLRREVGRRTGSEFRSVEDVIRAEHSALVAEITVCCATDGNHGRSVAWGAQRFGCACVIFVHPTVSEPRKRAIERLGARVIQTGGNYDESVREAQQVAEREGWFVVSDTSYPGYTDIPKDVMQGYEVMAAEALDTLDGLAVPPTHVFVQTGVGGLAAAVAAHVKRRYGADRPRVVLADPAKAACWLESIKAGRPEPVHGELSTVMAGLACGEVSFLAWEILKDHADAVVAVPDELAVRCMAQLARPVADDPPVVAGESAVAGLAALELVGASESARDALDLGAGSRILLFGTEGATDPDLYARLVGMDAQAVRGVSV